MENTLKQSAQETIHSLNNLPSFEGKDENELLEMLKGKVKKMADLAASKSTIAELSGMTHGDLEPIYQAAYKLYESGAYDQAKGMFERLTAFYHKDVRFVLGLASSYFMLKNYDDALLAYLAALMLEPENPTINYYIGDTFFKLHQYDKAKESYLMAKESFGEKKPQDIKPEWNGIAETIDKKVDVLNSVLNSKN